MNYDIDAECPGSICLIVNTGCFVYIIIRRYSSGIGWTNQDVKESLALADFDSYFQMFFGQSRK